MTTPTATRITLTVDLENNGATFWDALRALDANHPALVRWPGLRALQDGVGPVTIDASDTDTVEALPAFLASIDGWDDGDERAPHPVIVQVECDEDEDTVATSAAVERLSENVSDEVWARLVGNQTREEFAKAAEEKGETIEDAWAAYAAWADKNL